MLVLQRKKNEGIVIDDKVTITIADVGNDWVRLAIDAPKSIRIMRKELVEAASSNREAVSHPSIDIMKDLFKKE